jgi:hypothetical protein
MRPSLWLWSALGAFFCLAFMMLAEALDGSRAWYVRLVALIACMAFILAANAIWIAMP